MIRTFKVEVTPALLVNFLQKGHEFHARCVEGLPIDSLLEAVNINKQTGNVCLFFSTNCEVPEVLRPEFETLDGAFISYPRMVIDANKS